MYITVVFSQIILSGFLSYRDNLIFHSCPASLGNGVFTLFHKPFLPVIRIPIRHHDFDAGDF